MIYEALSEILVSEVPELVIGNTLFVNQAPHDSSFCAIFRDNPAGIDIDGYLMSERSGSFQFVVRGKTQAEISQVMEDAVKALTIYNTREGVYLIKSCRPTIEALSYQLSVANLREISVNFSINYGIVQ